MRIRALRGKGAHPDRHLPREPGGFASGNEKRLALDLGPDKRIHGLQVEELRQCRLGADDASVR